MRLVVLSTVLPLVLGLTACVAPSDESLDQGSALEEAVAAEHGSASPDFTEKAAHVVNSIEELFKLNHDWSQRLSGGSMTTDAQREVQQMVHKMRDLLTALPSAAGWVGGYVRGHRAEVKAGFATDMESETVRAGIGATELQKLTDAVNHAGGVDEIILKSTALVHDHSDDVSDVVKQGKKIPMGFFCGLAGTIAGANAARESWHGMVASVYVLMKAGCIR